MKKIKKIAVLGASGFIGSNITASLSKNKNYKVTAVYLKNKNKLKNINKITKQKINLLNETSVKKAIKGKDIIIHCAATSTNAMDVVYKPYLHVTENSVMGSWIFREAYKNNVKLVIFLSCSAIYSSSNRKIKETNFSEKKIPQSYFGGGWTKVFLEKQCKFYSNIGKTKFVVIRHSNMFGPQDKFDKRSHMMAANIKRVFLAKNNSVIKIWGDGKQKRDLLYIDDLVSFIKIIINKKLKNYNIFNVGGNKGIKIINIVKTIIKISKKNLIIELDKTKPDYKVNVVLDCKKAKLLGWKPKTSISEGILKTFSWLKKNIDYNN